MTTNNMIAKITFEEDGKLIAEKTVMITEDRYPDGTRMLLDSTGISWDILNEVEDIINNKESNEESI